MDGDGNLTVSLHRYERRENEFETRLLFKYGFYCISKQLGNISRALYLKVGENSGVTGYFLYNFRTT